MHNMSVHPDLQRQLLRAQATGSIESLMTLLAWIELRCAASRDLVPLIRRASYRLHPGQLASELVALSGQQPLLGLLLWRSLALNLITEDELLSLTSSSQLLTAALADLHEGAGANYPAQLASQAFSALVKLIATGGQADCAKHSMASVTATLRASWCAAAAAGAAAAAPAGWEGLESRGATDGPLTSTGAGGPLLLARLVRTVHVDVFPRQVARRWLECELAAVLQGPCQASPGWPEATAAFAAALPLEALLAQVQRAMLVSPGLADRTTAARGGEEPGQQQQQQQQVDMACQLLSAATAGSTQAGAAVQSWFAAQAAAALQRREVSVLRRIALLQRRLCGVDSRQYRDWLRNLVRSEQTPQQQGLAPGTRGAAAAAGSEGTQQQHRELQFVIQAVLMPMLPEEEDVAALEAQAAALAELGQLPATLSRLVQEYCANAQQRARALHYQAQERQQQHGQHGLGPGSLPDGQPSTAGLGPGSGPSLAKGQQEVAALLGEFRAQGGRLLAATARGLAARYSNAFMHAHLEQQVVPALLLPISDAAAVEERVALLQHLNSALPAQPAKLRARFSPDAVSTFRQRCLLAQLESASLEQLCSRLGEAVAKPFEAGGVGPHQILDRMEALVGERLCTSARDPVATADREGAAVQVESLLEALLNAFHTAYIASLAAPSAAGHASCAVSLAAHLANMIHTQRQLHGPLLRRLEQLVLVAGPGGQLDPQQALSLAMLTATMGAILGSQPGALDPAPAALFSWQASPAGTAGAPAGGKSTAATAEEVVGSCWLQGLLLRLPLASAAQSAWACRFTVALLSCLCHFHAFCTLQPLRQAPNSSSSSSCGVDCAVAASSSRAGPEVKQRLLLKPRAALPGFREGCYGGEWLQRLAFPLCPEAMQLLQWMQLRLSVAELLWDDTGTTDGIACQPGGTSAGTAGAQQGQRDPAWEAEQGFPHKRARLNPGPDKLVGHGSGVSGSGSGTVHSLEERGLKQQVQELCQGVVGGELGRSLTQETGKLRLADYLRWEAATHGAQGDLIPLSGRGCVVRLVCGEYLRLTIQASYQQEGGQGNSDTGRQRPQQQHQAQQQHPTGKGPRQPEARPQARPQAPAGDTTSDAKDAGNFAAQLLLPLLTSAGSGDQGLGEQSKDGRTRECAPEAPHATGMDVELQHRGSPEAATQRYVSDSSQENEIPGGESPQEGTAAATAEAVAGGGTRGREWPSKADVGSSISELQLAEAMACEVAIVLLDACSSRSRGSSSSTSCDDDRSQLPAHESLASAEGGTSAGQLGSAVSKHGLLAVVHTACAHLLRLLAHHSAPARGAPGQPMSTDRLGASTTVLLDYFLRRLVRSCQEGLPAFAAPAEPTAGAAAARSGTAGSSAHSSARLEAPAALLAFNQQDVAELGELVAALARQLCMEVLLLPQPLLSGGPVLHAMPGLAGVARWGQQVGEFVRHSLRDTCSVGHECMVEASYNLC